MSTEQQRRLIDVLLDTPEKSRAYTQEPEFYHGINLLVRVLPRFIDLMVKDSVEAERHRKRVIELINNSPPAPIVLRDLDQPHRPATRPHPPGPDHADT